MPPDSPRDVVTAKYWDQCNAVRVGAVTVWDSAQSLYYIDVDRQNYAFPVRGSCEVQYTIHLAEWQPVWNGANNPATQGLSSSEYLTTAIPAYQNRVKVYGNEP